MFATSILFRLNLWYLWSASATHTLHLTKTITYCSYIYNKVLSYIFKINMKKKLKHLIPFIMEKCSMLWRKILSLSNLSLFESETIFSWKINSERKKWIIVMDLCLATFRSFVVQWSAKIAGHRSQLKPLVRDWVKRTNNTLKC